MEEFHLTSVSAEPGQVDVFTGYKLVEERNIILEAPSITDTDIDIAPELFSSEHSDAVSEEEVLQLTLSWSGMKFCPVCGEKLAGISDVRSHLGNIKPPVQNVDIFRSRKLCGRGAL